MSTKAFTGGAGCGKTTRLLQEMEAHLSAHPLRPEQRVLALTFMHGSRHRLAERLAQSNARRHFDCKTLDRFSWEVCRRWRTRLRSGGGVVPVDCDTPDFDGTCAAAAGLLSCPEVADWLSSRYPVVVLDEFQDCTEARVALAKRLHCRVELLIAADDFQNLTRTDESPGVAWLRELGASEELQSNHRTNDAGLKAVANALRTGLPLPSLAGTSFKLIGAPSPSLAASFISQTVSPASGAEAVLLSATRPGNSKWVDQVIELVMTKQYGNQKAGPVQIRWEAKTEDLANVVTAGLGIADGDQQVNATSITGLPHGPVADHLSRWAEHQRRVRGRAVFGAAEVRAQINRGAQYVRSFTAVTHSRRTAMTIHQAKNREFSVVIVLWPFEVVTDPVLARRWLYNGITRARRRAIVIVHDPKKQRLQAPPFGCCNEVHSARSALRWSIVRS
jgi:superfamily I DNA/RNA helicase